jgi:seryl-tRNA synthetase
MALTPEQIAEVAEAVKAADVVMILLPDEQIGAVYKNDIETWMPSRKGYGETHSCSTFYDFQARRLGIKYETATGEKKFVHTLKCYLFRSCQRISGGG